MPPPDRHLPCAAAPPPPPSRPAATFLAPPRRQLPRATPPASSCTAVMGWSGAICPRPPIFLPCAISAARVPPTSVQLGCDPVQLGCGLGVARLWPPLISPYPCCLGSEERRWRSVLMAGEGAGVRGSSHLGEGRTSVSSPSGLSPTSMVCLPVPSSASAPPYPPDPWPRPHLALSCYSIQVLMGGRSSSTELPPARYFR